MAKPVSYADAVDLLSGESRTIKALDTALGWGLLFGGPITWSLIDAKNEAIRLLHQAVGSLREKVVVAPRATRTELLVAAHEVIMTTAFFEALDDVELPFRVEDMQIQGPDLRRFLNEVTGLRTCLLTRRPMTPTSLDLHELRLNYQIAASNLSGLVHALPLAKVLYSEQWEAVTTALHGQLHEVAVRRYQDLYHRLASEFPEFAFWAQMRAHESTQAGLVGLEKMLMEVTAGRVPSAQMARLHALNAAALTRPISQSEDQVGDLRMPSLGEGYVVPLFRQMTDPTHHDLSSESSWEAQTSRGDLGQVLAAHLTSPEARQAPMLILGQPGAGKSVLTKMLAARLPQGDFLPIRVPLRQVPADAGIQIQIQAGIHATTGETISWPDLSRSANGALPVILLDGLDELLQATGVNRADYLEQVVEFQQREESAGNPIAVIVTTRTAVADRSRVPQGSVALRLEPFSDEQVASWVTTWNRSTGAGLSLEDVLRYPDLARQPLLMLMLALYDADGASLSGRLLASELYERLLCRFALREIRKHEAGLTDAALDEAVEFELLRLSVAAFAMFNRGQQWVTHDELNRDLTALMPATTAASRGFQRPLTAAQTLFGRFFFIHKAEARQDSEEISTYEFLHATFGEHLIARLIRDLVGEEARYEGLRTRFRATNQTDLISLLSFGVLAVRAPILSFLREMHRQAPHVQPALIRLFQDAYFATGVTQNTYEPYKATAVRVIACRTANLVLLLTALTGPIKMDKLFGESVDAAGHWQKLVDLWRSGIEREEWPTLEGKLGIHIADEGPGCRFVVKDSGGTDVARVDWLSRVAPLDLPEHNSEIQYHRLPPMHLDVDPERVVLAHLSQSLDGPAKQLATMIYHNFSGRSHSLLDPLLTAWVEGWVDPEKVVKAFEFKGAWYEKIYIESEGLHWYEERLLDMLLLCHRQVHEDTLAELLGRLSRSTYHIDKVLVCALDLVSRDRDKLRVLEIVLSRGIFPKIDLLNAVITLMEMDFDLSAVPEDPLAVVRSMTPADFEEIAQADQHLFHRARRMIRSEGGRYGLIWPGPSPSPSG